MLLVIGCANTITRNWQRLGPVISLEKMTNVILITLNLTGVRNKKDVLLGLKQQNDLDTEHWAVVHGNPSADGHSLVMIGART